MQYYKENIDDVLKHLKTDESLGLKNTEVKKRLKQHGKNVLPRARVKTTRLKIFLSQWKSPLLFILLVAGFVSGLLREYTDMIVILLTAFINALIGYIQENKANRALEKLQQMVEYKGLVLRDGKEIQIPSEEIVPGDILFLQAGDKIQADGRIISSVDFEVLEAPLTGESQEIKKNEKVIKQEKVVADRINMVYRGTTAVNGHAKIVVTGTGEETEIGKIATMVKELKEEKTPLQTQLKKLSEKLGIIVLSLSFLIFILGVLARKDTTIFQMFETAVAIAVAAIPEGLIISLTVILAIGMQFILKRNGLVRRLVSAETLGSVSVICTDKTGTLTKGRMHVTRLITKVDDMDFDELKTLTKEKEQRHGEAILALRIGALCNNASLGGNSSSDSTFVGDTTETALAEMASLAGLHKPDLEKAIERMDEIPFDSKKKYMATLHHSGQDTFVYTKGAPEVILEKCSFYKEAGKIRKLDQRETTWFKNQIKMLTSQGLRVLAVAYKEMDEEEGSLKEKELKNFVLVGIVALSDPIRPEVKNTIQVAKQAGIKIIMVTGDHVQTAAAIAKEIGLPSEKENIVNGEQLQKMDNNSLRRAVQNISIFARVDPRDKIRIVDALKKNGEVVAMTGDGVNDAPALKGADIGVAVGSGTDVAKEIAELVILDDKFPTIVAAVEEGRTIYQNIKKVILYLLSDSFTEVILISCCLVAGLPLAILPVQILWVNLIEDSFPNMALAFDKGEKENMKDQPRKKHEPIIDKEMKILITIMTIITNTALFGIFLYYWKTTGDIVLTRTITFVALGIDSLFFIFSVRSLRYMIWQMNPFENKYIIGSVILGLLMLVGAVHLPILQTLLKTVSISWTNWTVIILFGFLNIIVIETIKGIFLVRTRKVQKI